MLAITYCTLWGPLVVDAASAQQLDLHRIERIADSLAHSTIAAGAVPGMTVAVAQDGEIVFVQGYGQADAEMGVAAGPETVYRIGSITKQFTAASIMRLVESGKIALDDPLTKYLPDYPTQGHHVTVRHLLNHTSGIGNASYTEPNEMKAALRRHKIDLSDEEMLDLIAEPPFGFGPGEEFDYNNRGYILLGMVIHEVTGMPYAEYVEQELLQPLGLDHTHHCDVRRIIPNRAEGYAYDDGELINAPYISMQNYGAAGVLCSTVGDLIRWTHLLHGGKVVSPASLRQMTSPTVLATGDTVEYGYGLSLGELSDHPMIYHEGSISGFQSSLVYYPEDGLTIAVLMNSIAGDEDLVAEVLARAAFGIELPGLPDLPLAAEDMARYEGTYTLQMDDGTLEVRVFPEDGRLNAELVGEGATPLLYQGDDVFIAVADHDIRLVFIVENGRAESATLHLGRLVFSGKREP